MTPAELRQILDEVRSGSMHPDDAHARVLATLRQRPFEDEVEL